MKKLLLSFCLAIGLMAQTGTPVIVNEGPSKELFTRYIVTSGNDTYVCFAFKAAAQTTITTSAFSNANPGVVTATAHGFHAASSPQVTISGGTGNWAAVNGTWRITYVDGNSFSIPVDTTSFGAVSGTLVFTTKAPRLSSLIWMVSKAATDGTNATAVVWSNGGYSSACTSPATLSYE